MAPFDPCYIPHSFNYDIFIMKYKRRSDEELHRSESHHRVSINLLATLVVALSSALFHPPLACIQTNEEVKQVRRDSDSSRTMT